MNRPPLWYLATPYTNHPGGIHQAFAQAARAAGELTRRGEHVFSPIAHSHMLALWAKIDPRAHAIWMPVNESFMRVCDGLTVVKLVGWSESIGVAEEMKAFRAAGKLVRFLSWPSLVEVPE